MIDIDIDKNTLEILVSRAEELNFVFIKNPTGKGYDLLDMSSTILIENRTLDEAMGDCFNWFNVSLWDHLYYMKTAYSNLIDEDCDEL